MARLLVTGFGPFPGAPHNPTEGLVAALAEAGPASFGAAALAAIVLPAEYRRSWAKLQRVIQRFVPDVVVHFGLSREAPALTFERLARRRCSRDRPDARGFVPASGLARRSGPDSLPATLPAAPVLAALQAAGFAAAASDDAGAYVCNATFYRSLAVAAQAAGRRQVGFVHVPPETVLAAEPLRRAAMLILTAAVRDCAQGAPVSAAATPAA